MIIKGRHGFLGATLLAGLLTSVDSRAAYEFYVRIEGVTQGDFHGDATRQGYEDSVVGLAYYHEVRTPISTATGQASGRRQHSPLTVTKRWGAATPQLFKALVDNERLSQVSISFLRTASTGEEELYHRINLTDASVVSIRQRTAVPPGAAANAAAEELEDVSFTFRSIEVESLAGPGGASIVVTDDWSATL